MRIVCISDTHTLHQHITLPEGDMLIHAGDFSDMGRVEEVQHFLTWFSAQPHRHKVFIAGNHDFLAERENSQFRSMVPANCVYLENSAVTIEGLHIWGSPITPFFFNWAFNRHRGDEIKKYWDQIPPETDLLVTHGPPHGIRDLNFKGELTGCEMLNERIWEVRPRVHVFGHIHEGYGVTEIEEMQFVNAAMVDLNYQPVHAPIVIEW